MTIPEARRQLNKLGKWRSVLAGWQLGTRTSDDEVCKAVRDHREATLLLRAEVTSIVALAIKRGLFSTQDFELQLGHEAHMLQQALQNRFPGIKATDDGVEYDHRAIETMKNWLP